MSKVYDWGTENPIRRERRLEDQLGKIPSRLVGLKTWYGEKVQEIDDARANLQRQLDGVLGYLGSVKVERAKEALVRLGNAGVDVSGFTDDSGGLRPDAVDRLLRLIEDIDKGDTKVAGGEDETGGKE